MHDGLKGGDTKMQQADQANHESSGRVKLASSSSPQAWVGDSSLATSLATLTKNRIIILDGPIIVDVSPEEILLPQRPE